MRDEKQENEFHIIVNNQKLEEIKAQDGQTYVAMPLFCPVSYGVEFTEEIKGHGAVEKISQKWPVCPYSVVVRNLSAKMNKATLCVDGQKVSRAYVKPGGHHAFKGIPTENGLQELLFSLPRFVTLKEKESEDDNGGSTLKRSRAKELGSVKIEWSDCIKTGTQFSNSHRTHGMSSFKQANKRDAKATGEGTASGGGEKAYASTTRAGVVLELNEPRSCTVMKYKRIGTPWEARLLYRTQHHLQDMGVIVETETDVELAERKAKRARRRKHAKSSPPPVPVASLMADGPPPVPADEEVVVV